MRQCAIEVSCPIYEEVRGDGRFLRNRKEHYPDSGARCPSSSARRDGEGSRYRQGLPITTFRVKDFLKHFSILKPAFSAKVMVRSKSFRET